MNIERSRASASGLRSSLLLAGLMAGALAGCGGSSSGSNASDTGPSTPPPNPEPPAAVTRVGIFKDSAVVNIGYRTPTQQGVTGENGEFLYVEGEEVIFFIGDLELPSVPAKALVTPLDIAGTTQLDDPVVVNLARLLQSLDADGNPDNSIQIPDMAAAAAGVVDFTLPVAEFANQPNVVNLVANSGSVTTTLVTQAAALEHLRDTLAEAIIGSWRHMSEYSDVVATFLPNGEYMIAEVGPDDESGWSGIERGTYAWDPTTGELTIHDVISDTNGDWGLSDAALTGSASYIMSVVVSEDGNEAVMTEGDEPQAWTFARVEQGSGGIVGSWTFIEAGETNGEERLVVATFLGDGTYFLAQDGQMDEEGGQGGVEYGVYEWSADEGRFNVVEILEDTNGPWGFSDLEDGSVTLRPEGERLYMSEDEGDFYFGEVCAGCEIPGRS